MALHGGNGHVLMAGGWTVSSKQHAVQHLQFLQELGCALSSEAVLLINVTDLLGQISDVSAELVVPDTWGMGQVCC